MTPLSQKTKNILVGLLFFAVVFVGIASPINYTFLLDSDGHNISNVVLAQGPGPTETGEPLETKLPDCGRFDILCNLGNFANITLPGIITGIILTATSWFLGAAGYLLNIVITFTVLEMANKIGQATNINIAWTAFRDLANMLFIFILLYIAIGTILRLNSVDTKKMLVRVIIVALLINFSLFFTKVIIDASNIITIGFYQRIATETTTGQAGASGLSGAFMNKLGITSVYNVNANVDLIKSSAGANAGQILLLGLFGGVLFMVTGFVFLAGAFMFIMRYVTLVFLLIFSPLAFAAMALPNDKYSSKWWNKLWENAIFAPVFMVLTWVVLKVLGDMLGTGGVGSGNNSIIMATASETGVPVGPLGMIMNFIIIIVMMVAVLIVSKELGAAGAAGAMKMGNKWRGKAQGVIGRGALRATGVGRLDKKLSESAFGQTAIGRGLRNITTGAATKAEFGSGQSISKVNKDLKTSREDYAKKQAEKVQKKHDEDEAKREFEKTTSIEIMRNRDGGASAEDRYAAHGKLLENERGRLPKLDELYADAQKRKAFAEMNEIKAMKKSVSDKVDMMQTKHNQGATNFAMDLDTSESARDKYLTDIALDESGKDDSKLRLKTAQRAEAMRTEEGGFIKKFSNAIDGTVTRAGGGAIVGGVVGGPLGIPIGAAIGALTSTKKGRKFIAGTKELFYGKKQSARISTVKHLRENADKGRSGGGSLEDQLKTILSQSGATPPPAGGGTGGIPAGPPGGP